MLLLPGALFALIGFTSTSSSGSASRRRRGRSEAAAVRRRGSRRGRRPGSARRRDEPRADESRARVQRYKEDVEREGKPFFPYAMFHDTVMSLVVVSVIVALACDLEVHDAAR